MKILIVDDDTTRACSLKLHLETELKTEDVTCVDCAGAARSLLRERYFDALVLDVVLPQHSYGRGSPENGLRLLDQVSRSAFLNKPERIIGITAHIEDLADFRIHFDRLCHAIVEAPAGESSWRENIAGSLAYTLSSKLARQSRQRPMVVITLHGIRTHGSWQTRLRNQIRRHTDKVNFYEYKYGYFSALRLLFPKFRKQEVSRLQEHTARLRSLDTETQVVVVCHSFGTYLATEAIKSFIAAGYTLPDLTLILCGSVLRSDYDWSFLPENTRVINECGADDYVLLLSEALVPGFGMAGKVGFHGFNGCSFVNRYFRGGHSHYFETSDFIEKHWVPLLMLGTDGLKYIDERNASGPVSAALERVALQLGRVKNALTFRA